MMRLLPMLIFLATLSAQAPQPEFLRQGQQLIRDGKFSEALALYRQGPDPFAAANASGIVLDLMGNYAEARKQFAKAIDIAPTPQQKAAANRSMAISFTYQGNCVEASNYERKVFDYYVSTNDFYQQGEIANEAGRICIDAGFISEAEAWYKIGYSSGLKEPNIKPDRIDLWNFRWEHAQARLAIRGGHRGEADKHVAAAKAILAKGTNPSQAIFMPYLEGYVAFYDEDYLAALKNLEKANQNDPFILCLLGQSYEELDEEKLAADCYRKAAATTAHNPPGAFSRPFAQRQLVELLE